MIDRDKVIKGLECCNAGTMCDECDYHISQFCLHELKADALALLKEQEAVEPKEIITEHFPIGDYQCIVTIAKDALNTYSYEQQLELVHDALALLKEQEPIEPIIKQEMDDVCSCIDAVAYCGNCGAYIGRLKQNYCHECGKAVKWE